MNSKNEKILWNLKIENVVKNIGSDSMAYKIMHIKESQINLFIYNHLMITGIILGPLVGVISSIGVVLNLSSYPSIIISQILLGFLSGITVAIIKFGNYDELSNSNKTAAVKYASLEANVRRQLSLYRSNRINSINYMDWLETKYEELLASSPVISNSNFESYKKEAEINDWNIPNSDLRIIEINKEFEEEKINEILDNTEINITDDFNTEPIKKSNNKSKIPEINSYSDKMLNYEMKRMMGFR